jgi:hypothetical protein
VDDARDDRFSTLDELAALFEAGSTEEFWRRLAFGGGLPPSPNSWEAELLWRHHHGKDRSGALDTALLLCTDHGCRRVTSGLIAAIASSGILDAEELARLARRFLEGTTITWEAPASWSEGGWIDIPLGEVEEPDSVTIEAEPGPLLFCRRVRPPLHRWAAAHLARHDPAGWDKVWEQADALDAAGTGAVLSGMLDALGSLAEPAASELLALGLCWPRGTVRVAALERLAERGGIAAARQLGSADPDAKIRLWATKLARPVRSPSPTKSEPNPDTTPAAGPDQGHQTSLFDLEPPPPCATDSRSGGAYPTDPFTGARQQAPSTDSSR